jgi:hypothetical protein
MDAVLFYEDHGVSGPIHTIEPCMTRSSGTFGTQGHVLRRRRQSTSLHQWPLFQNLQPGRGLYHSSLGGEGGKWLMHRLVFGYQQGAFLTRGEMSQDNPRLQFRIGCLTLLANDAC